MRDECRVKNSKCPRTFGGYCLVVKRVKPCYTCNVLVGQGVINGAEHDGDDKNGVSHLCDIISRGGLSVCLCGSLPA